MKKQEVYLVWKNMFSDDPTLLGIFSDEKESIQYAKKVQESMQRITPDIIKIHKNKICKNN